jgi:arsenate reductase (thioredoxin)
MRKSNVLFLCTGNSARSQMAETLLRKYAGDVFDAYSAGTDPQGVNPLAIQALREVDAPTDGLRSKGVREFLGRLPVRYLIVVCPAADHACPSVWTGMAERLFWPFDDPAAAAGTDDQKLRAFSRRARRNRIAHCRMARRAASHRRV